MTLESIVSDSKVVFHNSDIEVSNMFSCMCIFERCQSVYSRKKKKNILSEEEMQENSKRTRILVRIFCFFICNFVCT